MRRRLKRIEIEVFENLFAQQLFKFYLFTCNIMLCHSQIISQIPWQQNELQRAMTEILKRTGLLITISTHSQAQISLHIVGFHMTSLKFKLKNYRSYRDFTFTMH